ncbi:uncharacterized protein METZ01_LOCUS304489, partial [marine metagenome]
MYLKSCHSLHHTPIRPIWESGTSPLDYNPISLGFISLRRGLDKMDFDLKIVGGTIVDGSGRESYRGDVGILDGRVAALGKIRGDAASTLDAGDLAVCPGFVDIHT